MQFMNYPAPGGVTGQFGASMQQIDDTTTLQGLSAGTFPLATTSTSAKQIWMVSLSVSASAPSGGTDKCGTFVAIINPVTGNKFASVAVCCSPGQSVASNVVVAVPGIIVPQGVDLDNQWGNFSTMGASSFVFETAIVYYTLLT